MTRSPRTGPAPSTDTFARGSQDSQLDAAWIDEAVRRLGPHRPDHPLRRARGLLLLGLVGVALVVLWLRMLSAWPHLPLQFMPGPGGEVLLAAAAETFPSFKPEQAVAGLVLRDGSLLAADAGWPLRSPRWIVDDGLRAQQLSSLNQIGQAISAHADAPLQLRLADGSEYALRPQPRGLGGLGAWTWAATFLALVLYLVSVVVVLGRPGLTAMLYGALALSQCVNLLLIGVEQLPGLGGTAAWGEVGLWLRVLADSVAAAALLHMLTRHPQRLPASRWLPPWVWSLLLAGSAIMLLANLPGLWWWASLVLMGGCVGGLVLLRQSKRQGQGRNPLALALYRWLLACLSTLGLLLLAVVAAERSAADLAAVANGGSLVWVVLVAALLMLVPFLSRTDQILREFAILAGVSAVAASLDLLLMSLFTLDPLASLGLSLAVTTLAYGAGRHWISRQLGGSDALSAERMFDRVYRVARSLEATPAQAAPQIAGLLREVFDPLDVSTTSRRMLRVRVATDGSMMVVPVPLLVADSEGGGTSGAILLRFARRGQRLFTAEDQRLTERMIDQLRRAVAYDRAVERGRSEERARLAQDLHDDIGARLLTLMYKAPNAEIEDYIRHTLQDLKTLTRGLAASNHRLSHAAAEWKADISQRLSVAGCALNWSFSADRDIVLNVVQWSGLTRILRELVNNILSHARATQVEIALQIDRQRRLLLTVMDDGVGRRPEVWAQGLGLGGVRKRVRLLGGQVQWTEQAPQGIRCEVRVELAGDKP